MGKYLVTGASGFTGSKLCRRLRNDGHEVVAFVRPTSQTTELEALGVECRQVEIKSAQDVRDNFVDIEQVYHIAAAYRSEHVDLDEFRLVNVEATRNLLDAARATGIQRFVHCSTVGVQGEIEDPPADEAYRMKPGDHYQQSKLDGELLARKYFDEGLPGTVVRPVGIYGPGDTRFLKLFRAVERGVFVMIGNGKTLYHMTHVDDLVDGIVRAGHRQQAIGEIFTIGGDGYTTIAELVNLVADALDRPHPKWRIPFFPVYAAAVVCEAICRPLGISPPIYPRRVEFFQFDRAFNIDKAKKLLDYQPATPLKEGLQATADWYRENGLL